MDYFPGTTVKVFDPRLYKDDRSTPLSTTIKLATVLRWYGKQSTYSGQTVSYPSLIDVQFWHDGRESKAHFADEIYVEVIAKPSVGQCIDNLPEPRKKLFSFMFVGCFSRYSFYFLVLHHVC